MDQERFELRGFTAVDESDDPNRFVQFLDMANVSDVFRDYKQRTFALLNPQDGDYVLDVGCGQGDDVRTLAQLVGPSGKVVGVDASKAMIDAARQRHDLPLSIEFRVGDARRLDFADATFHRLRADRVFQHLEDPRQVLAEMVRVARSGARIIVSDPDWGTTFVDARDPLLTRRILAARSDMIRSPWIARQLPRLFRAVGLTDVSVTPHVAIFTDLALANGAMGLQTAVEAATQAAVVTQEEGEAWLQWLVESDRGGEFFAGAAMFFVSGQKP